jgi:hypothetical protein
MTEEYKRGFNKAIDRILWHCEAQAEDYARRWKEAPKELKIPFQYKALAILDFKLFIKDLFKTEVFVND